MTAEFIEEVIKNNCRGCFLGGNIGDALGVPVEFAEPGSFAPITCYRGGGPFNLHPGEWSDDSAMALALADSLTTGFDVFDQATKYCEWYKQGKYSSNGRCFDIGNTTRAALNQFLKTKIPLAINSGDGNGSIMRLAPIPIKYHKLLHGKINELSDYAELSSSVTHSSDQCRSACRYMTLVLAGLINGYEREEVLSPDWGCYKELVSYKRLNNDIVEVISGSYRSKNPPEITNSGWVVKTLEASLWAFHKAKDFKEAVLKSVNEGLDSDTCGCVTGQFAGAYWGEDGIPKEFIDGLCKYDILSEAVNKIIG